MQPPNHSRPQNHHGRNISKRNVVSISPRSDQCQPSLPFPPHCAYGEDQRVLVAPPYQVPGERTCPCSASETRTIKMLGVPAVSGAIDHGHRREQPRQSFRPLRGGEKQSSKYNETLARAWVIEHWDEALDLHCGSQ